MNAAFFDTSILAHAADSAGPEPAKRDVARALMQRRAIVISTQVMSELHAVMLRRLHFGADAARSWLASLADETVVSLSATDVVDGLTLSRRHRISPFGALIVQAATCADVDVLYTEDLSHGQNYGSVRVCNPFIDDFLE